MPDAGPPAKVVLGVSWEHQQRFYWCGPTATRMALSVKMANPPTESTLANFLGTTDNGTDNIGLVVGALNHYLNVDSYHPVYVTDSPTQAQRDQLKRDLLTTIGEHGYPMVVNIVAGWRPPFYPQGTTIYHYLAVAGYDDAGDSVLIADSAGQGLDEWANVPQEYWIATDDLATWIAPKGYSTF
jgi:hypothetical protein